MTYFHLATFNDLEPAIWQSYINSVISSTPDRSKYLAITDDPLLHTSKHGHLKYMEDLLKALLKRGVKISPKKFQVLRTVLQQMVKLSSLIKDKSLYQITKTRLEGIQKLKPPKTVKDKKEVICKNDKQFDYAVFKSCKSLSNPHVF